MTVLNVWEDLPSGSGKIDEKTRTGQRRFNVETDTLADNYLVVLTAPGIPRLYDYWQKGNETDTQVLVTTREAVRDRMNPFCWRVRIGYQLLTPDRTDPQPPDQYTIEGTLPEITITEEYEWEPMVRDTAGNAIVNKAGDFFDPQPEKQIRIRVYQLKMQFRTYQALIAFDDAWENKVNDDYVWGEEGVPDTGIKPGELLCLGIPGGTRDADTYGTYWTTELTLKQRKGGWQLKLENMGYNELVDTGVKTKRRRIRDENEQYVTQPVFLDANGKAIPAGSPPIAPLEFDIYEELDFDTIGLPPLDVTFTAPTS